MASRRLRPGDPRRLGDYRLLARLGEGGMGTVFLGRDVSGRSVAVKAIRPEYAGDPEFRARFRSEVDRARQVPSFCTAAVLDADPDHETPYLVVEYVDGPSLREVIEERGPLPAGDLHGVAVGVAAALTAIHGAGVIHRDLKPGNVLMSPCLPKVIDFGIARALEATSDHTRTGQFVGTVDYMAPERLDPSVGPVTEAADIFAWGAVVAFAGTGHVPFRGDTPMAAVANILTGRPDLRGLPEPLAGLVAAALTRDPRGRPSANDLVQRLLGSAPRPAAGRFDARELLEHLIAEGPERAKDPSREVPRKPVTTRRLTYAVGALLLASVTAFTFAHDRTGGDRAAEAPRTLVVPAVTTPSLGGPSFFDPLRAPGRFRASAGDRGSCSFRDGHLRARVAGRATYQCAGPGDVFAGDQSITVDLSLATAGACAMVWFRYRGDRGYQLTACPGDVELEELDGAILTTLGRTRPAALRAGARHEVCILIVSQHATVEVDGRVALQAAVADPHLAAGRIQLGVTNGGPAGVAEVSFTDLGVRAA